MMSYSGLANLEIMREAVKYNQFLIDLVVSQIPTGGAILDFGAGVGTFALPLAMAGHNVICVEPDPGLARQLEAQRLPVHRDLAQIGDSSLDYIYSLNVLEHIADDMSVLALWRRKLCPGATLLLYVPAFQVLFSSMDRRVGHYRRYRLRPLRKRLHEAGFIVREGRYVDSLGFVASLLFKLIDRRGTGDIKPGALRLYDRFAFPLSRVLDRVTGRLIGKNLYIIAERSGGSSA